MARPRTQRQPEADISDAVFLVLGARPDLCKLWHQRSGTFWLHETPPNRPIVAVPAGLLDFSGVLIDGRRLELDAKTPTGRLTAAQRERVPMLEAMRCTVIFVRSGEEALWCVEDAVRLGAAVWMPWERRRERWESLGRQGVAPGVGADSMSRALPAERSGA